MTFETRFDPAGETTPTLAVVNALAVATNTGPLELSPLYKGVDPDKLNALVEYGPGAMIQFTHSGYDVTVHGTGQILLEPTATE